MENNKEIADKIKAEIERIRRKYLDSADEINRIITRQRHFLRTMRGGRFMNFCKTPKMRTLEIHKAEAPKIHKKTHKIRKK